MFLGECKYVVKEIKIPKYINLSEEEKQKKVEYMRKRFLAHKK